VRQTCERVGCSGAASVAYGIDIGTLVVWLEFASPDSPHHLNVLCDKHAERLILPRGWSVDDRREGTSRLFVAANKDRVATRTTTAKSPAANRGAGAKGSRGGARRQRDATAQLRVVTNDGLFDPTVPMAPPTRDATGAIANSAEALAPAAPVDAVLSGTDSSGVASLDTEDAVPLERTRDVTQSHPSGERRFFDRATANHTRPVQRPSDASRAMFRDTTRGVAKPDDTFDFHQGDHVE
jgi:hypothetical protein